MANRDFSDFLSGRVLYGDSFAGSELDGWYGEEANAYTDLYSEDLSVHEYQYWLSKYGFDILPTGSVYSNVLGFGSGFGSELVAHQGRMGRLTILESSSAYEKADPNLRLPVTFIGADPSGDLQIPDCSINLIVCLGVLHHIPNVSHVVKEFSRVIAPGGYAIIREPVISMGDWRVRRRGLTKNERGLPLRFFESAAKSVGFVIESQILVGFPPVARLSDLSGVTPYNSRILSETDRMLCRIASFNYSYHAESWFKKLRPTSCAWVLRKS